MLDETCRASEVRGDPEAAVIKSVNSCSITVCHGSCLYVGRQFQNQLQHEADNQNEGDVFCHNDPCQDLCI